MEKQIICLDTSVLIDYFRKVNKSKSFFYELTKEYDLFAVSAIKKKIMQINSKFHKIDSSNIG